MESDKSKIGPSTNQTEAAGQTPAQGIRHRSSEGDSKSQRLRKKLRLTEGEPASLRLEDRKLAKPEAVAGFNSHSTTIY